MAKTFYVPVSGESVKPKKWYVPVNGESAKAVKAYCSVNGVSKQFWGDTPAPTPVTTRILYQGIFTEATSESCRTKSIVNGGTFGEPSASSNGVIINKNLGWFKQYSQTANYPWTFESIIPPIRYDLVSGNIKNMTGIQDDYENLLCIPVIGSILNTGSVGTEIGGKIRFAMKGTDQTGPFIVGVGYAQMSSGMYYFDSMQYQKFYFNPQAPGGFPLDEDVYVEMELTNNKISSLKSNLHDGYWFLFVGAPPNYGYTPKVHITNIEYIDLT